MLFSLACELCGQARTTAQLDLRTHRGRTVFACIDIEDCTDARIIAALKRALDRACDAGDRATWRRKERRG